MNLETELALIRKRVLLSAQPERLVSFSSVGSDRQLAFIAASCQAYGHTIVGQTTGSFRKALALARYTKANGLIIPDLESSFRDLRHIAFVDDQIGRAKKHFWVADLGFHTADPFYRMMILQIQIIGIDFMRTKQGIRDPNFSSSVEFPQAKVRRYHWTHFI